AHLEEGIDAPNEGHGEIEESRNGKIGPHDRAWAHAATSCVSVHALSAVAVRITAPPITASGPGVSPCASHAHTGLSTGSTRRNSDASSAGTCVIARDRNTRSEERRVGKEGEEGRRAGAEWKKEKQQEK